MESKRPLVGKVCLDRICLAGVHDKHLRHSRELLLRKRIAEQKVNNQGTGVQFLTKEKFLIIIIGQYKQNYFRFG